MLRHAPKEIGLSLDADGWASVDDLTAHASMPLTRDRLAEVVAGSDKQRFALSLDGSRIRASQGHSIPVDLDLSPLNAPASLYHGTAEPALAAILTEGLRPMARHHVHLSPDAESARKIWMRHSRPVVLEIATGAMQAAGHVFFRSDNGVWLAGHIPTDFLTRL